VFAVILTSGFWLLALPFYPRTCATCGREATEPSKLASALALPRMPTLRIDKLPLSGRILIALFFLLALFWLASVVRVAR
jgi:hypothetical protein